MLGKDHFKQKLLVWPLVPFKCIILIHAYNVIKVNLSFEITLMHDKTHAILIKSKNNVISIKHS